MSDVSHSSTEKTSSEEIPLPFKKPLKPSESFSLSALFLLMVVTASLFGLAREALTGVNSSPDGTLQSSQSYSREIGRKSCAFVVLMIFGLIAGPQWGWKLQHRKSGVLLGLFFAVAAVIPALLFLSRPPHWMMVIICCALIIATGYLLRMGRCKESLSAEKEVLK